MKNKDWKPLRNLFTEHVNFVLQNTVAIFHISQNNAKYPVYAIVSVSKECDEIIINYGGETYEKNDGQIHSLKEGEYKLLFGEKNLLHFINWRI